MSDLTGSGGLPPGTDSLYGTPPDPIPELPPPPASVRRFVGAERILTWQFLRNQNHRIWQTAVSVCGQTATSTERYGDIGMWCAIVAATNDDAAAAAKAIEKLKQASPGAVPNTIREEFIARVLMLDLVTPWVTSQDLAAMTPIYDQWASHSPSFRVGDSDAFVGEGIGAILWDLYHGRIPNRANVISELGRYPQAAAGGQWFESSQYNSGTVTLLAMGNHAHRTATGFDVVPGVSSYLTDAGRAAAMEVTPDLRQAIQWGDDQYPRDFAGRLYRRLAFLAGLPHPEAQWTLEQLLNQYWPVIGNQLMAYGLFLWRLDIPPSAPANVSTHVSPGIGMLYRRDGATLAWAMAKNDLNVDHSDFAAPFDMQVYQNGWLLTHPIAYYGLMSGELIVNGPVYAGLSYFADPRMTWSATGSNWAAIAGATSGGYFATNGYPPPAPFLRYGGRVVVHATVGGQPVIIVRDSVDMDDPRTVGPGIQGYRQNATYQHQARITDFDGKMWALWHMPNQPQVNGTTLSWIAPNGSGVTLRSFADQPITIQLRDEQSVFGSDVTTAEKGWQARLHAPSPVLFQVFTVGNPSVARAGNTITVGGQSWTVTSAGVTGP